MPCARGCVPGRAAGAARGWCAAPARDGWSPMGCGPPSRTWMPMRSRIGFSIAGRTCARPTGWNCRRFVETGWQVSRDAARRAYGINTYRVLLTRARYDTLIYVPLGDPADATRHPAEFDAIADFLTACGVPALAAVATAAPEPVALLL